MRAITHGPVIVVNDHEWTARSIESLVLTAGHRTIRAFTIGQLEQMLERESPDALILDTQLPEGSAIELLPRLRERGLIHPALPVILTTAGPSGRQLRLQAAEAGAWEFFGQPLDGGALLAKLEVFLAAHRTSKARLSSREPREYLSGPALLARVTELGSLARRLDLPLSGVSVVVPGDDSATMEEQVVQALRRSGRASDTVGCLAPGHFMVVALGADATGAEQIAARLERAIRGADLGVSAVVRLVEPDVNRPPGTAERLMAAGAATLAA
jgi:two-component system NtrC family response regulator